MRSETLAVWGNDCIVRPSSSSLPFLSLSSSSSSSSSSHRCRYLIFTSGERDAGSMGQRLQGLSIVVIITIIIVVFVVIVVVFIVIVAPLSLLDFHQWGERHCMYGATTAGFVNPRPACHSDLQFITPKRGHQTTTFLLLRMITVTNSLTTVRVQSGRGRP